ncbi:hypothetical protein MTP99_006767 [Tenebrio molitor]|nr:hypothetical protein MTP99_006767 [Tenebrio molitor]
MSRRTGHSSFPVLDDRVVVQWDLECDSRKTVLVSKRNLCRRRSSSGVGARFLPGRALPGWCLHEVVWLGEGETVNRKVLESR